MSAEPIPVEVPPKRPMNFNERIKAGLFLGSVSGVAATAAFCMTLAAAKKKDPRMFSKGTAIVGRTVEETGVDLAMRALKWGTFYAIGGTSLVCFGIWKLSGAKTMDEFKQKMGQVLPRVPKNEIPIGRTEFSGLNDLLTYIADDYQKDVEAAKAHRKS